MAIVTSGNGACYTIQLIRKPTTDKKFEEKNILLLQMNYSRVVVLKKT